MISKFNQIQENLRKKLYSGTKLQLLTPGKIKKFPRNLRSKFILPTTQDGEFGTYHGTTLSSGSSLGSKNLTTDSLPDLNDRLVVNVNDYRYGVLEASNNSLTLFRTLEEDLQKDQVVLFDSYSLQCDGNYEEGFRQLLVKSRTPIIPGDQLFFPLTNGDLKPALVMQALKTQNPDQWDILLDRPIISEIPTLQKDDILITLNQNLRFQKTLENGNYSCLQGKNLIEIPPSQVNEVLREESLLFKRNGVKILRNHDPINVTVSSSIYWENVDLDIGPCILNLPAISHIQEDESVTLSHIQILSGNKIVDQIVTKESTYKIHHGTIPAISWLTSQLFQGKIDYLPGLIHLIPEPNAIAKLTFLDVISGEKIQKWSLSLRAESPGHLITIFDGYRQKYYLKEGLNSLLLDLPQKDFSWIEFSTNTEIYFGGLTSFKQYDKLNLAIQIRKSKNLGSHVIGKPSLHSILRDPSVTWAKVGLSGVNRGFTLTPADNYEMLRIPLRKMPPAQLEAILPPIAELPTGSLIASPPEPQFGSTEVTLTPIWKGDKCYLGTRQGFKDVAVNPSSGVPIPIQVTGFKVESTYWMRVVNLDGDYFDVALTIKPQTVRIELNESYVLMGNKGFGYDPFGIETFGW